MKRRILRRLRGHRFEVEHYPAEHLAGLEILERRIGFLRRARFDGRRADLALLGKRDDLFQLLQAADVRADDADRALGDGRQRMDELAAVKAADDVAAALPERRDAERGGGGASYEIDRRRDSLNLLQGIGDTSVDHLLCSQLLRRRELRVVDVATDDVAYALCLQDRDADEAEPAAAEHRYGISFADLRQLARGAVGGHCRAGERCRKRIVDAGRIQQVLRVGHDHVGGVRSRAVHAQETRARDAVVVLSRLAHGALAAADPGVDELFLPDAHAASPRPQGLHDAERLVAERKRRHAATLLDVEALAAAEIEVAIPDVQVGVAHARARDSHEHLGSLRLGRFLQRLLQRLAVLDDLPAHHFADSVSAWSMSQRMSSSVSRPTDMRTMSGVTPALIWSASSIWRCVVEAGWMIRVFASPMLARWLMNWAASMKRSPAFAPPFTPKFSRPDAPLGRYFFARGKYLLSGSPG